MQSSAGQSPSLPSWQCCAWCLLGQGWSYWLPGHFSLLFNLPSTQNTRCLFVGPSWSLTFLSLYIYKFVYIYTYNPIPVRESGICPHWTSHGWLLQHSWSVAGENKHNKQTNTMKQHRLTWHATMHTQVLQM